MRKLLLHILLLGLIINTSCKEVKEDDPIVEKELQIRAADLSFLPEIEAEGTIFYDTNGVAKDALTILHENGCNTVRLRLWHTPGSEHSTLTEVASFAQRARAKGMKVWVDIHYSDTWADPGQQTKPAAWQSLNLTNLTDSVYNYTQKVVTLLSPDYIQIGNEINDGFLWEDGRMSNENNFITLLKSGIRAVRENASSAKIIIHIAGIQTADWFFDRLRAHNVDYDIIGLSYYPAWHGKNIYALSTTMSNLATENSKSIVIAETAYPFTLDWNDWTNNPIGLESHLIPDYPATEEGQKAFLLKVKEIITKTPNGLGFSYWAPDWVAFRGETATNGSAWENMTLFDFENKALAGIEVFNP